MIYMASPQSKYARYDKFVPVLTNGTLDVTTFKALPLFFIYMFVVHFMSPPDGFEIGIIGISE